MVESAQENDAIKRILQWKEKHNWLRLLGSPEEDESHECGGGGDIVVERRIRILGEIVGATNLVAAKRENELNDCSSSSSTHGEGTTPSMQQTTMSSSNHGASTKNGIVNSYCEVYWGDELIHQTKVITKK